jgi:hypothetical protein
LEIAGEGQGETHGLCLRGWWWGGPGTTSKEEGSREIISPEMKFVLLVRRSIIFFGYHTQLCVVAASRK